MKNTVIFFFLFMFFLQSCTDKVDLCPNFSLSEGTIQEQDEYLILEAIVEDKFPNDFVHISQASFADTDSLSMARYFDSDEIQFSEMGILNYIALNSEPYIWGDLFDSEIINLISEDELQCLFGQNNDGFNVYNEKYPDSRGYLIFGRPYIEDNKAIVCYISHCGSMCSSGWTVTLEKILEEWSVVKHHIIWVR